MTKQNQDLPLESYHMRAITVQADRIPQALQQARDKAASQDNLHSLKYSICSLSGTEIAYKDTLYSKYILETIHPLFQLRNRSSLIKAINKHGSDKSLLAGAILTLIQEHELCQEESIAVSDLAKINTCLRDYPIAKLQLFYKAIPIIADISLACPKFALTSCCNGIESINNWIQVCLAKNRQAVNADNTIASAIPSLQQAEILHILQNEAHAQDVRKERKIKKKDRLLELLANNKHVPKVVRALKQQAKLHPSLCPKPKLKSICVALDQYDKEILLDSGVQHRLAKALSDIHKSIRKDINEIANQAFAYIVSDLRVKANSNNEVEF